MPETVFVRGENGLVVEHDLPLSHPIADRVSKGYLVIVPDPESENDEKSTPRKK